MTQGFIGSVVEDAALCTPPGIPLRVDKRTCARRGGACIPAQQHPNWLPCQPATATRARPCAAGFTDVRVLTGNPEFEGVKLIKAPGQHGSDECLQAAYDRLGEVCGVVLKHPNEKTRYLAGDTVFNDYVTGNLSTFAPDVVVVNGCGAQVTGFGSIIMNAGHVRQVYRLAPQATIVASHMEAVNHAMLTRAELRSFLADNAITDRVLVPEDGEVCALWRRRVCCLRCHWDRADREHVTRRQQATGESLLRGHRAG